MLERQQQNFYTKTHIQETSLEQCMNCIVMISSRLATQFHAICLQNRPSMIKCVYGRSKVCATLMLSVSFHDFKSSLIWILSNDLSTHIQLLECHQISDLSNAMYTLKVKFSFINIYLISVTIIAKLFGKRFNMKLNSRGISAIAIVKDHIHDLSLGFIEQQKTL